MPAGKMQSESGDPGVLRNIDCVVYCARGLAVGAFSISPYRGRVEEIGRKKVRTRKENRIIV